jgi:hypothetical protein
MSKPLLTRISCIALVGIVGVILFITITSQAKIGVQVTLSALWGYVMGDAHSWAVSISTIMRKLTPTTGFFFAVFIANIFQVAVSALYLLYNHLLTVMVVALEWNNFISTTRRSAFPHPGNPTLKLFPLSAV